MIQHTITLTFEGELESHNWEQLRDTIIEAACDGITDVVLDFGRVTFFDSSAIHSLLSARRALEPRGVTIRLGPCSKMVQTVVDITGIGKAFPSWPPVPTS